MAVRGERFVVDLSDDDDHDDQQASNVPQGFDFVADIQERVASATPPAPPRLASTTTGFPSHRIRSKTSAFKRQRNPAQAATQPPLIQNAPVDNAQEEKSSIDRENKERLASMSDGEIRSERAELLAALSPSLIEKLLKRANIDDGRQQTTPLPAKEQPKEETPDEHPQLPQPNNDIPPAHPPQDLQPASEPPIAPIHFPKPPQSRDTPMPNLDPSSPSFLADLQTHYFPDIPHDTSSLSWLKPADEDPSSAYHPDSTATSLMPDSLRFSLNGAILAPKTSLALPTTLGLHHHAKDPEAAGYTIPELAILSCSTVPAQRCLAWQLLGRLLYRLGKGEFGQKGSVLVEGLWSVIERENVISGMLFEASGESTKDARGAEGMPNIGGIGKHASARAWATEGVWLWRQGGGGDRGLRTGKMQSK